MSRVQETIEKTDANGKILPEMVSSVLCSWSHVLFRLHAA